MEKLEFENLKQQKVFDAIIEKRQTLNFSMLKTCLRKKDIKVNGQRIKDNVEIFANDKVEVFLSSKKTKEIPVVFEDENIIIVHKPQGIETTKKDKTYFDSKSLEELVDATACHRLDKNTEGLVVLAKNKIAENCLTNAFKNHDIKKTYTAIVFGKIDKNGEKFDDLLQKNNNFVKIFNKNTKDQKDLLTAKLSYIVKKQVGELFEIDVDLETGRTHQIRAQLAHHGIFVLGDEKYGDKTINKKYHQKKQLLCAKQIAFENISAPLHYLNGKVFETTQAFDAKKVIDNL